MKLNVFVFFIVAMAFSPALYAGFIEPATFPKVATDMSFVDRMALASAGYEPYESEYDENGKCISGCSYVQMNLEDEISAMERWNAMVKQDLVENHGYTENEDDTITPPEYEGQDEEFNGYYNEDDWNIPFPGDTLTQEQDVAVNAGCAIRNTAFENRGIPYRSPLGQVSCITSGYGIQRKINGRVGIHYAIDLRAAIGTPLYAPAAGTVTAIYNGGTRCGRGLSISHTGGYSTNYCHLSQISVTRGQQVSAGCLIGKTGNTGVTTGAHLHYSVKKNGNSVNPKYFIEIEHKMCH